jgi:glycosyltransferase involved in cell wall biosynthesis
MKVALFIPNATFDRPGTPEVGGIETFSFTVGEALQRLGHDVVIFGGAPKPGRTHRATTVPLELHPYWETKSIPDIGTRFQRLVQRLHYAWSSRQAWSQRRVDLVILAKPFDWPVAWFWKKARPELKVVMGFHGTDFYAGDRLFYGAIDAAFAVSSPVADLAEARVGKRPTLIPNPVDVDFFSPGAGKQSQGPWHIVSSGRLVGWKGFANLIEAFANLVKESDIDARLSIAGDGPEREALAAQIVKLGLQDRVTLCGLLAPPALRDLLRSGDLYVQPSIGMEAFSISALEAVCVGLPLVLSDQVGLGSYLTDQDAVIYPARDVAAFSVLLKKSYERRHDPTWIAASARHERQSAQFSPEQVARRILGLVG